MLLEISFLPKTLKNNFCFSAFVRSTISLNSGGLFLNALRRQVWIAEWNILHGCSCWVLLYFVPSFLLPVSYFYLFIGLLGATWNCYSERLKYHSDLMIRITEFPVFMIVFQLKSINVIQIWIAKKEIVKVQVFKNICSKISIIWFLNNIYLFIWITV